METFRGRNIIEVGPGYPAVYHPEHEMSNEAGIVYIHRLVVSEHIGRCLESGEHVHHIDGDLWNWSLENLKVLTPSEHAKIHHGNEPVLRFCNRCGEEITVTRQERKNRGNVYCNRTCQSKGQEVIDWPSYGVLKEKVRRQGVTQTGRELGVSHTTVRRKLDRMRP